MRSSLFWNFTQRRMVVHYQSYGTTYRSHIQGSCSPRRKRWWLSVYTVWNPSL